MSDWGLLILTGTLGTMLTLVGYVLELGVKPEHRPSVLVRVASWLLVTLGLGLVSSSVVILLIAGLLAAGVIS